LNEDILALILQAEDEYHDAVENAAKKAEDYAGERKKNQNAYIEELKHNWRLFETSENEKLALRLSGDEQKLEAEMDELKKRLTVSRDKKADQISERLKKEVLSLYGSC